MARALPLIAHATAVVIWATTFVVSSSALAQMSPAVLTVVRFVLAVAVLVPLAARRPGLIATASSERHHPPFSQNRRHGDAVS
ncbi:MAG: EamA family transporter [Candidatus Microbacterium colombiense]|nr:MAG: EamA family transporter [Microbacterium sp.]